MERLKFIIIVAGSCCGVISNIERLCNISTQLGKRLRWSNIYLQIENITFSGIWYYRYRYVSVQQLTILTTKRAVYCTQAVGYKCTMAPQHGKCSDT